MPEKINHPEHYATFSVNYEPADLTERMVHPLASAIEYLLRAGHKDGASYKEDLAKALWWLRRVKFEEPDDEYVEAAPDAFIMSIDTFGWELLHKFGEKRRFVGMLDEAIHRGEIIPEKFNRLLNAIEIGINAGKEEE